MIYLRQILQLLIILLCASKTYTQTEQQLLSEAIYEEEINGDLSRAIDLYNQILQDFISNRTVTAEALWRLGLSHEKLGHINARQYYEQLVISYLDQPEFNRLARLRLQQLNSILSNDSPVETADTLATLAKGNLKTSKVFSMPSLYGTVSADGKYFCYTNWDNGNLAIYNRYTGKYSDLNTEASWMAGRWCDGPKWSPDNKRIVYTQIRDDDYTQLRIYDVDNRTMRALTQEYHNAMIWSIQWAGDGNHILASLYDKTESRSKILLVSVPDGIITLVKLRPKGEGCGGCNLALNPDGEKIIYDKITNNGIRDLWMMSKDGSGDKPILVNPSRKSIAGWLSDNRSFLYYSNLSGYNALWKATMSENFRIQDTELLLEGLTEDFRSIGLTNDGIYYYIQSSLVGKILTLEFDLENDTMGREQTIPTDNPQPRFNPVWSPDASKIAYIRTHPKNPLENRLEIKNLSTGDERLLELEIVNFEGGPGNLSQIQWSPDNIHLSLTYWDSEENKHLIVLINTLTGGHSRFVQGLVGKVFGPKNYFFYVGEDEDTLSNSIIARDLSSGNTNVVYSVDLHDIHPLALSMNGQYLSFIQTRFDTIDASNDLMLVDLENGDVKTLWQSDATEVFMSESGLNWLHDNRRLLVAVSDNKKTVQQLYMVDIISGQKQPLGDPFLGENNFIHSIHLHPTENKLVYDTWQQVNNIWALENY